MAQNCAGCKSERVNDDVQSDRIHDRQVLSFICDNRYTRHPKPFGQKRRHQVYLIVSRGGDKTVYRFDAYFMKQVGLRASTF